MGAPARRRPDRRLGRRAIEDSQESLRTLARRGSVLDRKTGPLDACLYALQPRLPHPTRSSLHRCLQRHGISCLPDMDADQLAKKSFKRYPIGYVHIAIAEVRSEEGKLCLFVAPQAALVAGQPERTGLPRSIPLGPTVRSSG
jgi:hypothetical protein